MKAISPAAWLICPRPNPRARLRLFCFPYAGGGTAIYRAWPSQLPANVETWLIQLPGRETRYREAPHTVMPTLVRDLTEAILPCLDRPFAFFGHSMGALIAFELARYLSGKHGIGPERLFVSGRGGPQFSGNCPRMHQMPDADLCDELRRMNGTPTEILDNDEMMRLFLPVLRADFTLVETYTCVPGPLLNCPIWAFGGDADDVWPSDRLDGWRAFTRTGFHKQLFPGNHFFLNSARAKLLQTLSQKLTA